MPLRIPIVGAKVKEGQTIAGVLTKTSEYLWVIYSQYEPSPDAV